MAVFWVLALLLFLQSAVSLREGFRFLRFVRASWRKPPGSFAPPTAVIIPAKGVDADFETNLSQYLAQDYPWYQIVFVVASRSDPAHAALAARLRAAPREAGKGAAAATLVVAGYSDVRGEKVNNLVAGVRAVDAKAEVLVFADTDARPRPDWLRSLVAPLADPAVTVSTGFRWYLPGVGFVSKLRAAWDTSIATLFGDRGDNIAWGGSMAIRSGDFARLEIAERHWARTVSDDYALTRAVRQASGTIRFEPRCLLASRQESSFREFLNWSNRQIIITRVYARRLWLMGLASHALYGATFLLGLVLIFLPSLAAAARLAVAASLGTILSLGLAKGRLRGVVAREIFPEEAEALKRYGACYWRLAPLVPWVMLVNFAVAAFTRRIEWRGTHYELRSADEVRVLGRD